MQEKEYLQPALLLQSGLVLSAGEVYAQRIALNIFNLVILLKRDF